MNEIDVQPAQAATEETVRLLRATRANEADDARARHARHSKQTDRCPPVARFSAVLRCGSAWTADEAAHVSTCKFCKQVYQMFVTNIATVSDAGTIVDRAGDTVTGRAPTSGEETTVEGPRRAQQPQAAADDTVTDDKRAKKKRG
jgi:hypothetical protein